MRILLVYVGMKLVLTAHLQKHVMGLRQFYAMRWAPFY
ncbi:hypothetical protein AX13_00025 [Comamonas aquatica DA1877]|uniref:Uncharacterized protein n=1 Tax=Comamonas aquatica DA1877 TaxID=1457173 RepID=A0A014P6X4_9BURK|nr:hypothetical protein AX13_00025 [Comamonas aquatica DA1877]